MKRAPLPPNGKRKLYNVETKFTNNDKWTPLYRTWQSKGFCLAQAKTDVEELLKDFPMEHVRITSKLADGRKLVLRAR